MDTDQLANKLSTLEGQFRQLLLRLQRVENEHRDLKTKFRSVSYHRKMVCN
jgi:uncharacterized protein (UPF0335 family)